MNESATSVCPHLGLVNDRTLVHTEPDAVHRCYAQSPAGKPDTGHQRAYCVVGGHTGCRFYGAVPVPGAGSRGQAGRAHWQVILPSLVVVAMLVVVGVVYGRDLFSRPAQAVPSTAPATQVARVNQSPAPANSSQATPASVAAAAVTRQAVSVATATAEPGGRAMSLSPRSEDVGWWASGDARASHMGDSFLYSGYYEGKVFIAAFRLDLRGVPRGAPIRQATLQLTGLQAERFHPEAGGAWSVQFLAPDAVDELSRSDFQKLFNAPTAMTLFPALYANDLEVRKVNAWSLEPPGREWLAQQIAGGVTSVIVRVVGPSGGADSLFAWDSGSGPATTGEGPRFVLNLGPVPATPPPLPTQAVIVATPSPTPANVLTAAANSWTATAVAKAVGTYTPVPANIVTPTPLPANLATAQALGYAGDLPALVVYTPTPRNRATATANAAYATAVAATTGTFTPVPTNAVTPIMVMPTPEPENVMTAAAQSVAATARVQRSGTPTPLPYGALIATVTPRPYVVVPTAYPANAATAIAEAVYATAVAMTTGTFTPMPAGAMTPTPLPLLVYELTPHPSATPTPRMPDAIPAYLKGKILFYSDRDGDPRLMALDPNNSQLAYLTQDWPYLKALSTEGLAPDGKHSVIVRSVATGVDVRLPTGKTREYPSVPQLVVLDTEYKTEQQITHDANSSYDAVWSPKGDRVAFVSTQPGNDEIFAINPDGNNMQRLTTNTWEWDKHPSWSPDGSRIAFWSNRETGRRQLWVMNADGSDPHRLLDTPYNDWDPVWVK